MFDLYIIYNYSKRWYSEVDAKICTTVNFSERENILYKLVWVHESLTTLDSYCYLEIDFCSYAWGMGDTY